MKGAGLSEEVQDRVTWSRENTADDSVVAPRRGPSQREFFAHLPLVLGACVLGTLYFWRGGVAADPTPHRAPGVWFGVGQWALVGSPWIVLLLAVALLAGVSARSAVPRRIVVRCGQGLDDRRVRGLLAAAAVAVCWLASTRRMNLDGSLLQWKFEQAVPRTGAFITLDEMMELYLHSRLWAALNAVMGWDVGQTYRVSSCLAGGVAMLLAVGLARRFPAQRRLLVVAGFFSGGWILVFFGDVENYTLTNVAVLAYLAGALRYLDDRDTSLWPSAAGLAIAVLFHLQALILGPSFLVLVGVALRRGRRADALVSVLSIPILVTIALWWFDRHGFPLRSLLTRSQISRAGSSVAPAGTTYLWQQLQLLLLLAPSVVLLPALLTRRGLPRSPRTVFLAVASVGAIMLVFLWPAQLGPYGDWNLFAVAAQPLSLLVYTHLAAQRRLGTRSSWIAVVVVLAAIHTAMWILANHTSCACDRRIASGRPLAVLAVLGLDAARASP